MKRFFQNIIPYFSYNRLHSLADGPDPISGKSPGRNAYALIKHYEGFRSEAYRDGNGVWTVGYGFTRLWGRPVRKGDYISREDAEEVLKEKIADVASRVRKLFKNIQLKQCQYDALVSFAYNLGYANLRDSTLRKVILRNPKDYKEINYQFSRWIHVAGKPSSGLIARRKSESLLYRKGILKWFN